MELAIAHGYRRATVKGYSASRDRERARPARSGRNDLAKLRSDMASMGGVIVGSSPDGPVH